MKRLIQAATSMKLVILVSSFLIALAGFRIGHALDGISRAQNVMAQINFDSYSQAQQQNAAIQAEIERQFNESEKQRVLDELSETESAENSSPDVEE